MDFPKTGTDAQEIMASLRVAKKDDVDWRSGRTSLYVQFGGDDVMRVAHDAAAMYLTENVHGAAAFPSAQKLRSDVIGWLLSLTNASALADGAFTASGSESILLCMKAARDWARQKRPGLEVPHVLVPASAHPAFDKAGQILGMEVQRVAVGPDQRADVEAMADRLQDRTVMIVGSAPQFAFGVVDPIGRLSDLAVQRDLWLHVDACIGALFAPFARANGIEIPPFDFTLPGVRSMSSDLHKYGFSIKGASAALFRHKCWRPFYTFEFDDWPIGNYASGGVAGSASAAPVAAAWAVMSYLGHEGYTRIASDILQIWRDLNTGLQSIDDVEVLTDAEFPILAWRMRRQPVDQTVRAMQADGWFARPMLRPPAIHTGMLTLHQGSANAAYLESVRKIAKQ